MYILSPVIRLLYLIGGKLNTISLRTFLVFLILFVISLILLLLCAAVIRRIWKGWKYTKLDRLRINYAELLRKSADSGTVSDDLSAYAARPKSVRWQAIEDVLLAMIDRNEYFERARELFFMLGYAAFNERQMGKKDIIEKITAITKLGKMASLSSAPKIIEMLDSENGEVVTSSVKALCQMGSPEGLQSILDRLPAIMGKANVSQKVIETSLAKFGPPAVPVFVEHAKKYAGRSLLITLLGVLAILKSREALPFVLECLNHEDPEIRATALKAVIPTQDIKGSLGNKVVELAGDSEWYVRLNAAKVLGMLSYIGGLGVMGKLLLDSNWHVRNAAATALTRMGNASLGIFLETLKSNKNDLYVVGNICEEIEKSLFVFTLFHNLKSDDETVRKQSREILNIMRSIHFYAPFVEYVRSGEDEWIKNEISQILSAKQEMGLS